MSRPVIVDFSRVEEALRLSSSERDVLAARERAKNAARLIKYSAAGSALVIVSIGIAFWLGTQWHHYQTGRPNIVTELFQRPSRDNAQVSANKIVTNINLFNSIKGSDLSFFNPYFVNLTAGHEYVNSNADAWVHAWCYAAFRKDDLTFQVELEVRNRGGVVPVPVSQNQRRELSLSDSDVAFLRGRCPWR